MKRKVKVDIISDIVCPWCYMGEKRLQKAIAARQDQVEAEIHFLPFELNPDLPETGVDQLEYLAEKFGSKSRVEAMHQQLVNLGKADGLIFNFQQAKKMPNTFKGHRLIWLANQYDQQENVARALFSAYFAEGKDVGDDRVLIEIGGQHNIPVEKLESFFQSNEGVEEVRYSEKQVYQMGIQAVPAFIIDDRFLIRGAQPVEVFEEVLEKVAPAVQEIVPNGQQCAEDSCDI